MKSVRMEKGDGQTKTLFLGIQGADGAFAGEGTPQYVPNQPGLAGDPQPAVCLDPLV